MHLRLVKVIIAHIKDFALQIPSDINSSFGKTTIINSLFSHDICPMSPETIGGYCNKLPSDPTSFFVHQFPILFTIIKHDDMPTVGNGPTLKHRLKLKQTLWTIDAAQKRRFFSLKILEPDTNCCIQMIIITVNQRRIQYDLTTKTARTRGNYNNTHWDFLQKFHLYYFTNPRIQKPCSKIRGFLIGWSKDHNLFFLLLWF